jgi:protein TonB
MLKSPLPAASRRTAGAVLVAVLSLGAACAAWATAPKTPTLIAQPDWIAKPTGADIKRLYPAQALKQGVTGKVVMTCRVDAAGKLQRCALNDVAVTGENLPVGPNADLGFGAATLKLAELFQMKPTSKDGVATAGGEIRIPVRWGLPQSAAR